MWTNFFNNIWGGPALGTDSNRTVFVTGNSVTLAYSTSGALLWTRDHDLFQGSGFLAIDKAANIFVSGSAGEQGTFPDYLTIKYSNSGVPLWTNRYDNGPHYDYNCVGVAVDGAGSAFVTGYSLPTNIQSTYDFLTIKYSAAPEPIKLNFQFLNRQLVLNWADPACILQSAVSPGIPFTNIFGATSPYTNTLSEPQQFFRLTAP